MSIRDLIDQFEIQGMFNIKVWNDEISDYEILANGKDFECEKFNINEDILERRITYLYAVDGVLNIEIEEE